MVTLEEAIIEYQAADKHHREVYKKFGWPSKELEAANDRCLRVNIVMKFLLKLGPFQAIPAKYLKV